MKINGLFLQLEIDNRIYFSSVVDDVNIDSFMLVWEAAGPKIWERLTTKLGEGYISNGSIRVVPICDDR